VDLDEHYKEIYYEQKRRLKNRGQYMQFCSSVSEKPKRNRFFGFMDDGALLSDSQVEESSYFLIDNGPTPRHHKPAGIPRLDLRKVEAV
jgi:hypothetical protein